jgi:hypothetical protein
MVVGPRSVAAALVALALLPAAARAADAGVAALQVGLFANGL